MVMRRADALEDGAAGAVRAAPGGLPGRRPAAAPPVRAEGHAACGTRSSTCSRAGGVVVASGGSAAALCDPMVDPRGGAFTLGLGLVDALALVTEAETWSPERLHRTLALANTPVAILRTGQALVRDGSGWSTVGDPEIRGELPPPPT